MQNNMFTMKGMSIIAAMVFVVGFMFAKLFFTQQTIVRDGLQGVVINPEVPRGTCPLRRGRTDAGLCFIYYESSTAGTQRT